MDARRVFQMYTKLLLVLVSLVVLAACGGDGVESTTTPDRVVASAISAPATTSTTSTAPPATTTISTTTTTTMLPSETPEWAAAFSEDGYEQFVDELALYFESSDIEVVIDRVEGSIVPLDDTFQLGSINIAQALAYEDESTWATERNSTALKTTVHGRPLNERQSA